MNLGRACLLALAVCLPARVAPSRAGTVPAFAPINAPGFGDYQNSYAWSMAWFQGKLYVGTARNFQCVELATLQFYYPHTHNYPPKPGGCPTCTPNPYDLNLQGEIWCYSPSAGTWTRVFQSPNDLPNPKAPGKYVARDIGFRDMAIVQEPDRTTALYVAGVSAREYIPGLPWPRLLRSTDGIHFNPVPLTIPNAPAGFMGLRAMASFNGKFYLTASTELTGEGAIIETDNPATGKFRVVSAPGFRAYELATFNNHLYVGAADQIHGYSVLKTSATGTVPYTLTPVVTHGAGRGGVIASVVSMHPFNGRLYVGSAGWGFPLSPCEIIRVNANDTWDVVVGDPRSDPVTRRIKYPISGLPDGFANPFNAHIWRMEDYQGSLYAGTNDVSFLYSHLAPYYPGIATRYGFDIFSSRDGVYWSAVTQNGFGTASAFGARTLAGTPSGLFVGSADSCIGTKVYLDKAAGALAHAEEETPLAPPPSIVSTVGGSEPPIATPRPSPRRAAAAAAEPPARLVGEVRGAAAVLSWDPAPGAVSYLVSRAEYRTVGLPALEGIGPESRVSAPGPARRIGTVSRTFFRDPEGGDGSRHLYSIQSVDRRGQLSAPSNMVLVAGGLASPPTYPAVAAALKDLGGRGKLEPEAAARLGELAEQSRKAAAKDDLAAARRAMEALHDQVNRGGGGLGPQEAEDLASLTSGLLRRIILAQSRLLPRAALSASR